MTVHVFPNILMSRCVLRLPVEGQLDRRPAQSAVRRRDPTRQDPAGDRRPLHVPLHWARPLPPVRAGLCVSRVPPAPGLLQLPAQRAVCHARHRGACCRLYEAAARRAR